MALAWARTGFLCLSVVDVWGWIIFGVGALLFAVGHLPAPGPLAPSSPVVRAKHVSKRGQMPPEGKVILVESPGLVVVMKMEACAFQDFRCVLEIQSMSLTGGLDLDS